MMKNEILKIPFNSKKIRIHHCITGNQNGPKVILIHGLTCNIEFWKYFLNDKKLRKTFLLIALDLPGHGLSEKPRWFDYSMENFSKTILALIKEKGISDIYAIIGFSMGGLIAIDLWEKLMTKKLILVEPVLTSRDVPISKIFSRLPVPLLLLIKRIVLLFFNLLSAIHLKKKNPENIKIVSKALRQTPSWVFKRCCKELVKTAYNPMTYKRFKEIPAEKFVLIRGDKKKPGFDPPEDLSKFCTIEIIPDSGHAVMLDNPEVFNEKIRKIIS